MHNEAPFVVLGVWGVVTGFCWIVWVIATNFRIARVARIQGQMQAEMVERLGASKELMTFLQTEAGQKVFTAPPQVEPRRNPFNRIMGSLQAGIVLGTLGLALFALSNAVPLAKETFLAFGGIAGAIGFGLILSSLVSFQLSKSMGLIDRTNRRSDS